MCLALLAVYYMIKDLRYYHLKMLMYKYVFSVSLVNIFTVECRVLTWCDWCLFNQLSSVNTKAFRKFIYLANLHIDIGCTTFYMAVIIILLRKNPFSDAVKENFPTVTDDQFEKHVMAWFQHATTRYRRQKDEEN